MMQKQPAYILALNQIRGQVDQYAVLSDPQTLNLYAYSKNNPIIYSDPSGLFYYQASAGGSLLLVSGSAGFQWNNAGANFFFSAGPALSVGVHGELPPFATGKVPVKLIFPAADNAILPLAETGMVPLASGKV